jgi:hypothetical protein
VEGRIKPQGFERSRSQRVQLKLDMDVVFERLTCLHVLQG